MGKVIGSDGSDGETGDRGPVGPAGERGESGNGIASIEKISTSGLVDTYRITFDDGDCFDYMVTNGSGVTIVDNLTSDSTTSALSAKQGKVLNTNKLDANQGSGNSGKFLKVDTDGSVIPASGGSADIVTSWESTLSDTKVPSEKLTKNTLDTKINTSDIVNDLSTGGTTKVLSAEQGKQLNTLIGNAILYINQ